MATLPIQDLPRGHERSFFEVVEERRATDHFEPTPVTEADLHAILRAGTEAPSGYNIQPWRFVVVRDPETRTKLSDAAMGQPKVGEAPVVVVACGDPNAYADTLDEMLKMAGEYGYGTPEIHGQVKKTVSGIFGAPAGDAMGVGPDWTTWLNRHVMIAFTTMMWAAEVRGYDTAPMEGFFESKVREVLGIPGHVRVIALLAIGRRRGTDKKYGGRFPLDRLCFQDHWGEPLAPK